MRKYLKDKITKWHLNWLHKNHNDLYHQLYPEPPKHANCLCSLTGFTTKDVMTALRENVKYLKGYDVKDFNRGS